MRAANAIYDVPEARPFWKTVPIQLVVTAVTGMFLAVSALAVVFTGRLAQIAGRTLGIEQDDRRGSSTSSKWPVLVLAVGHAHRAALLGGAQRPAGRLPLDHPGQRCWRWCIWVAASAGFAFYIAQFDSYNRTYGALGGVIVFLVWLWLTNLAVLIGAEFDAELGRSRAIAAGLPPTPSPTCRCATLPRRWRRRGRSGSRLADPAARTADDEPEADAESEGRAGAATDRADATTGPSETTRPAWTRRAATGDVSAGDRPGPAGGDHDIARATRAEQ